jgi:hypothetical protein
VYDGWKENGEEEEEEEEEMNQLVWQRKEVQEDVERSMKVELLSRSYLLQLGPLKQNLMVTMNYDQEGKLKTAKN